MDPVATAIVGRLGFTRVEDVSPDTDRPGLLRARTLDFDIDLEEALDYRMCALQDACHPEVREPGLERAGFETVDLSTHAALQRALDAVRDEDRVSEATADALRQSLRGARFRLRNGRHLHVEHVADDGMIQRRAGPNGLQVNAEPMSKGNGHGPATRVHADQDVFGTPLRQMMNGGAPGLFRHQTPDGRNDEASLLLLNLWIPIHQITCPLALMDRRSLDAARHQLRYGLPVTRFLDRDEETSVNDIWMFLPHPEQRWFFRSSMGPNEAYVFDTLGEPHGAATLPGEEALAALYRALDRAGEVALAGDANALRALASEARPALPEVTTHAIRDAWGRMVQLLDDAGTRASEICRSSQAWCAAARAAMDAVVRRSVEMRLVATLTD